MSDRNKRMSSYLEQRHAAQLLPRIGDRYAITSGFETKVYEVSSMGKLDDEITIYLSPVIEDSRAADEDHPAARGLRQQDPDNQTPHGPIARKVDQD